jgi:hypothetical protein
MVINEIYLEKLLHQMESSYLGIDIISHYVNDLWHLCVLTIPQGFVELGNYVYVVRDVWVIPEEKKSITEVYLFKRDLKYKFKYFQLETNTSVYPSLIQSKHNEFVIENWEMYIRQSNLSQKRVNYVSAI